jgi:hypothetical protein
MIAAERDELVLDERLDADRQPVDACGTPRREPLAIAIGRVRLERDLAQVIAAEPRTNRRDRRTDALRTPQRRCAAAEIDRDEIARKRFSPRVELPQDGLEIRLVLGRADLDREIAVRAQLAAPRVVEVDA